MATKGEDLRRERASLAEGQQLGGGGAAGGALGPDGRARGGSSAPAAPRGTAGPLRGAGLGWESVRQQPRGPALTPPARAARSRPVPLKRRGVVGVSRLFFRRVS